MSVIIFIIILLVLVVVHEAGHFFSAKFFGIRVDEFGFGFPPKIFGIRKGETEYTFNLLPIGGFVKIFGESPNEENMYGQDSARSLVNKAKWKQAIVLFAGVFMNFLLAWLLFSFGFIFGMPTSVEGGMKNYPVSDPHTVIVYVAPKSPAEKAGLKSGDKIIDISSGDIAVGGAQLTPEIVKSFIIAGGFVDITYIRGQSEEQHRAGITPAVSSLGTEPQIGIAMDVIGTVKLPLFSALYEGMGQTLFAAKGMVVGLYRLIIDGITGRGSFASVTGPVGLVGITGDAYRFGFIYLLSFAALISVNLGIINLFPFPALDGGRLFFLLIEKIKGSRMNPIVANTANMIGFGILILLMVVVTYHDVVKLL